MEHVRHCGLKKWLPYFEIENYDGNRELIPFHLMTVMYCCLFCLLSYILVFIKINVTISSLMVGSHLVSTVGRAQ